MKLYKKEIEGFDETVQDTSPESFAELEEDDTYQMELLSRLENILYMVDFN